MQIKKRNQTRRIPTCSPLWNTIYVPGQLAREHSSRGCHAAAFWGHFAYHNKRANFFGAARRCWSFWSLFALGSRSRHLTWDNASACKQPLPPHSLPQFPPPLCCRRCCLAFHPRCWYTPAFAAADTADATFRSELTTCESGFGSAHIPPHKVCASDWLDNRVHRCARTVRTVSTARTKLTACLMFYSA